MNFFLFSFKHIQHVSKDIIGILKGTPSFQEFPYRIEICKFHFQFTCLMSIWRSNNLILVIPFRVC